MSSIHEAIYKDIRRDKGPMPNFVALTSKQEKQGDTTDDDFHNRIQARRLEERERRALEGGRGGGFNDRQDTVSSFRGSVESHGGVDDFGRRVADRSSASSGRASSSDRAKAALERLQQSTIKKAALARLKEACGHGATNSIAMTGGGRREERSRSRGNRSRSRAGRRDRRSGSC
eukprot:TRINITY_DN68296_c0_g1_i1.p2 TRINITY_DN68296_c0_g1~~TRINITY_DN68296_c0_g1_i1.p2  ORF type:complete len:175 (-),score=31.06 TRINITY_DN68296_c0_g1_i1:154-678(-)